jgi:hypothetical protein
VKVKREWVERNNPDKEHIHIRHFISSRPPGESVRLGTAVREHWSVENRNHHKRDDSVWQEDRHRFRRVNVAQNLALTRNALLAIIPFDEERNLPSLIADYQESKQLAINLILKARPFP